MSNTAFVRAMAQFPIQEQSDLDQAVRILRKIRRLRPNGQVPAITYPRALALLSFAMLTSLQDGWSRDNEAAWGPFTHLPPGKLKNRALKLARQAWKLQQALPGKGTYDYDVLWALALALLANGNYTNAEKRLREALAKTKDWNCICDSADSFVYLGKLQDVAGSPPQPGARTLVDGAINEALNKVEDVPDWFRWVSAWVSFAEAAVANAAKNPQEEAIKLDQAIAELRQILPDDDPEAPIDFDAGALLAAAVHRRSGLPMPPPDCTADEAQRLWDQFLDEVAQRRRIAWSAQQEMARANFDINNATAMTISTYWRQTLADLDK